MATLRVTPLFTVDLTLDELRLIHRGLHLLCASKSKETAKEAKSLAAKLAADRKSEFDQRARELEKLLVNIEKDTPPPASDRDLLSESGDP